MEFIYAKMQQRVPEDPSDRHNVVQPAPEMNEQVWLYVLIL